MSCTPALYEEEEHNRNSGAINPPPSLFLLCVVRVRGSMPLDRVSSVSMMFVFFFIVTVVISPFLLQCVWTIHLGLFDNCLLSTCSAPNDYPLS